jgi:2-C-methyl-D-erythritol 4-phosphate cytidylyltransferase
MRKIAILLSGGSGSRMGSDLPKQFLKLENGLTILATTVLKFAENCNIDEVIVVANESFKEETCRVIKNLSLNKPCKVVNGGNTRQESSFFGVKAIENPQNDDVILIHDVARPFVSNEIINNSVKAMEKYDAASTVVPSSDTIYLLDAENEVIEIPERKNLCNVQTPQTFKYQIIMQAHSEAEKVCKFDFTDDSGMVHYFKLATVGTVAGDVKNKKITYLSDIEN